MGIRARRVADVGIYKLLDKANNKLKLTKINCNMLIFDTGKHGNVNTKYDFK